MDNAATTYPKPDCVKDAVMDFIMNTGASAGRSGHALSIKSGRIVYDARCAVAELFGATDPERVIFTNNATSAINMTLHGYLNTNDKAVTSLLEHNSTMRPLHHLVKNRGVLLDTVSYEDMADASKGAKLVALSHGNNVTGSVADIRKIADIAHGNGAKILVDAAQTAGLIDIDIERDNIDFLAASGHKGLYGPQGTGFLILGKNIDHKKISTIMQGGTGSRSEYEEQPETLPDKFESGTGNSMGIAGLLAGVRWVQSIGVSNIYEHEKALIDILKSKISDIEGIKIFSEGSVLSFVIDGLTVSDIGRRLDDDYGVMSRVGLHCSPATHKFLGTFQQGTVRLSPSYFTTKDDILKTAVAIREIASCR